MLHNRSVQLKQTMGIPKIPTSCTLHIRRHGDCQRQVTSPILRAVLIDSEISLARDAQRVSSLIHVAGIRASAVRVLLIDSDGNIASFRHRSNFSCSQSFLLCPRLTDISTEQCSAALVHNILLQLNFGDIGRIFRVGIINCNRPLSAYSDSFGSIATLLYVRRPAILDTYLQDSYWFLNCLLRPL